MQIAIKAFTYLLLGIVLLLVLVVGWTYTPNGQKVLTNLVTQSLQKTTGSEINMEQISIVFPNRIRLYEARLGKNDNPFLTIKRAEVAIALFPLLHGELHLTDINIDVSPKPEEFLTFKGDLFISKNLLLKGNLKVSINDFSCCSAWLQGNANGNIEISGPVTAPEVNFHLLSNNFSLQNVPLTQAVVDAKISYLSDKWQGTTRLSALSNHQPIELNSTFVADRTSVQINDLSIKAPETEIAGTLALTLPDKKTEGEIKGTSRDLSFLQPWVPYQLQGESRLAIKFTKNPSQIIDFDFEVPTMSLNHVQIEQAHVTSRIENPLEQLIAPINLSVKRMFWQEGRCENFVGNTEIDFTQSQWPFSVSCQGKINKSFEVNAKGKWNKKNDSFYAIIEAFSGKAAKIPFSLKESFFVSLKPHSLNSSPIILELGKGNLHFSLNYSQDKMQTTLMAEQIPLSLVQFVSNKLPISGTISGHGKFEGPLEKVEGDLVLSCENFAVKEITLSKIFPLQGKLEAHLRNNYLTCIAAIKKAEKPSISLHLKLPIRNPLSWEMDPKAPLSGHLAASVEIETVLKLLMLDADNIAGKVDMGVDLSGTLSEPIFSTQGEITHGAFESHHLGTILRNVNASFEGNREKIVLKRFTAHDGFEGSLTGHGEIALLSSAHYPFKIFSHVQNAALITLDYVNANLTGDLNLVGDLNGAELKGNLVADPLNIVIPEKHSKLTHTVDITYINQPEDEPLPQDYHQSSFKWPIALDISLRVPNNGYISGRDLTSQWHGDLKIKGAVHAPLFYGEYKIVKGQYTFNGKEFEINEGTITLAGDLEKKTSTYVIASKDLDEVKVEIILKGPIKKPAISFRSNPPLPQREILSWILFNRGTSEITPFQGSQLNESITNLETKQNGPDILTKIRKTFGIDRIDIGASKDKSSDHMSLQVGKYISKGFYVSVNKSDVNRLSVEASLLRNVKLQAEVGDDAEGQILLKWKQDY